MTSGLLMARPGQWVDRIRQRRSLDKLILDMDPGAPGVSETDGQQEGSMYNGHFRCTCYHPLFIFNQDGDVEGRESRSDASLFRKPRLSHNQARAQLREELQPGPD